MRPFPLPIALWLAAAASAQPFVDRSVGLAPHGLHSIDVVGAAWLAGGEGRVFESLDSGRSWRTVLSARARGPTWVPAREEECMERQTPRGGLGWRARRAFRHLSGGEPLEAACTRAPPRASLAGLRHAKFTAVARGDGLACAGGERGLWCAEPGGAFVRVGGVGAVRALLVDPVDLARILVATRGALLALGPRGQRTLVARLRGVRLLASAGRRVFAVAAAGLFSLHPRRGLLRRVLAGLPRILALAARGADLYVATARGLWRLETGAPRAIPGPSGGPAHALTVCGPRLFAANEGGLWVLGPFGWRAAPLAATARALGCARRRLVAATAGGLWVEMPQTRAAGPLERLPEPPPAGPRPARRLARRARRAAWLPRLALVARAAREADLRSPLTAVLWPDPSPRWRHDPVLRLRKVDRFEALLLLHWPLGERRNDGAVREALRVERRLAVATHQTHARLVALWSTLREEASSDRSSTLAALRQRLWRAELRALLAGFTEPFLEEST